MLAIKIQEQQTEQAAEPAADKANVADAAPASSQQHLSQKKCCKEQASKSVIQLYRSEDSETHLAFQKTQGSLLREELRPQQYKKRLRPLMKCMLNLKTSWLRILNLIGSLWRRKPNQAQIRHAAAEHLGKEA